ncbi:MAG: hypothetical protein IIA17_04120 [candidate division Zixibacteria bacterium]|nr:hypothetical protein [candidate division Zixibacteria bacterium]
MKETVPSTSAPNISLKQELLRKSTHIGALVIPGGYYFLGLEQVTAFWILSCITLLMLVVDVSRLRNWWFWRVFGSRVFSHMLRKHEQDGDLTGASYILLTASVSIALFSKPVAIAAISFIIVGDVAAALIGRKFGRTKIGNKTLEGSLGCLAATFLVAVFAPGISLQVALLGALVATLVEAWPMGVDDNVSVPLLSGLAMTMFIVLSSIN